ncbi:hypothetical protein QUB16_31070 [Microcoleus sp. D3_18a_C4]
MTNNQNSNANNSEETQRKLQVNKGYGEESSRMALIDIDMFECYAKGDILPSEFLNGFTPITDGEIKRL